MPIDGILTTEDLKTLATKEEITDMDKRLDLIDDALAAQAKRISEIEGSEPPGPGEVELPAPNGTSNVNTAAALMARAKTGGPAAEGEWVVMADVGPFINPSAWTIKPGVIVRIATPGGATVQGQPISVGERAGFYGPHLRHALPLTCINVGQDGFMKRFTMTAPPQSQTGPSKWIQLMRNAKLNRFELWGKTTKQQCIQYDGPGCDVYKMYLHDCPATGQPTSGSGTAVGAPGEKLGTPAEGIMIGSSDRSSDSEKTKVRDSLIARYGLENEAVTSKSCDNEISGCTFQDNRIAGPTARHGNSLDFLRNIMIDTPARFYGADNRIEDIISVNCRGSGSTWSQAMVFPCGDVAVNPPSGPTHAKYAQVKGNSIRRVLIVKNVPGSTPFFFGYRDGDKPPINNDIDDVIITGNQGNLTEALAPASWAQQNIGGRVIVWPTGTAKAGPTLAATLPSRREDPRIAFDAAGVPRLTDASPIKWDQSNMVLRTPLNTGMMAP